MSLTRFMILFISYVITYVKPSVKICWVTPGEAISNYSLDCSKSINYNQKKTYVLKKY